LGKQGANDGLVRGKGRRAVLKNIPERRPTPRLAILSAEAGLEVPVVSNNETTVEKGRKLQGRGGLFSVVLQHAHRKDLSARENEGGT